MVDNISKPFTFYSNTYAKASEVNADFDTLYTGANACINQANANATNITNLGTNKADKNGSSTNTFAVADAVNNVDAINKQTLMKYINNSLDYISGLQIRKDSGSPNDTIIVSVGSCYDSTKSVVLALTAATTKQNTNQAASATYYVYIIGDDTGSSIDILISTSSSSPALPTGYTKYRQIGHYTTGTDNKIKYIYQGSSSNPDTKAVVIETYANGSSWYRIWSDKWCEQGDVTPGTGNGTVTFLKAYANTNYTLASSTDKGSNTSSSYAMNVLSRSKTQFTYYINTTNNSAHWYACGYIS